MRGAELPGGIDLVVFDISMNIGFSLFPNGKYGDQVDSTAQAPDWFKTEGQEAAITTFYRLWSEGKLKDLK